MLPLRKYMFVLPFVVCSALSVHISSQNETAEYLWKLYNFALQSRQIHSHYPYPYSYKYPGKYPEYYQNYHPGAYGQYPGSSYSKKYYPYKLNGQEHFSHKPAHSYAYPSRPHPASEFPALQHFSKPKESVMDILYTIAKNDDLQCVPKLICEVTSGTISGRQQGLNLPVNINMESLLGFFSTLNGAQSSPLLYFGKAALLGFSSKGNTGTCSYAYPECPSDADKVVNYLNNHNGGFFRFFNGFTSGKNYHQAPYRKKQFAEQRIQNNAVDLISNNFRQQSGITFPRGEETNFEPLPNSFRSEKNLKFPSSDFIFNNKLNQDPDLPFHSHSFLKFPSDEDYDYPIRKPKEFHFNSEYSLDLQKPLPNHKASPMIFPVRTGTGDLRLDPEELQDYRRPISYQDDDIQDYRRPISYQDDDFQDYRRPISYQDEDVQDYRRPISYQDDDVKVVFNGISNGGINFDAGYDRRGRGFSFPS